MPSCAHWHREVSGDSIGFKYVHADTESCAYEPQRRYYLTIPLPISPGMFLSQASLGNAQSFFPAPGAAAKGSGHELNTIPGNRQLPVMSLSGNNCIFFPERVQHVKTPETHRELTLLLQPVAPEPLFGVLLRKNETSIHKGDGENVCYIG